jgi:hypothetical protein
MIEVDGFRLSGGGCDFNNTTKRDIPFPNSSSTAVSIKKVCDDPNDPNYWKENITTNEDRGIKVPISQPGIPLTEFAERLIALEQENVVLREELEQLKEVVSITLSLTGHTFPLLSQYYGHRVPTDEAAKKVRDGLWDWAKDHGVEFIPFELSPNDGLKILKNEEDDNHDTEGKD